MDRERAKELLPIIQAFAEGKTIQWRGCLELRGSCEEWADLPENELPLTTFPANDYEYRIKPEKRYVWMYESEGQCWPTDVWLSADPTQDDIEKYRLVRFVETFDD